MLWPTARQVIYQFLRNCGGLNRRQPMARQDAVVAVFERIPLGTRIFQKQPAELTCRLVHESVETQSWNRQAWQILFVQHPFNQRRSAQAFLGDDGATVRSDSAQPVNRR